MKLKHSLLAVVVFLWSQTGMASESVPENTPVTVKAMRLDTSGQVSPINTESTVAWLREAIAEAQQRLAAELPGALHMDSMEIELVSVPHPESGVADNKLFVQWKSALNPARLIPVFGRVVEQKADFFVALEVRVSAPGQTALVFPGRSHTQAEYRTGIRLSSAFLETLSTVGKKLFDEAIDSAIVTAKETHQTKQ